MNRTIKEATVKRFHYEDHESSEAIFKASLTHITATAVSRPLRSRLRDLANERRRSVHPASAGASRVNRIYRLYREEGLSVRKRKTRRRAVGTPPPILVEAKANARVLR